MNILFISKLSGNLWAGPNNSVPAQIKAQSQLDNCFWYNLNSVKREEWQLDGLNCKNLTDHPSGRLADLPVPFNAPDVAIVEEVYCYPFEKIISDLIKKKIPYVIVPRSTLTIQAQKNKRIKKILGNIVWFNRMIKCASAIQYLTIAEQSESVGQWNVKSCVIPNGIYLSAERNTIRTGECVRALYIGRIDIYQKGFDILLEALNKTQDSLRKIGFHLKAFGPNREDALSSIIRLIESYGIGDLISFHDAVFKEEKQKQLRQSDLFVMASRFEGLPMGLIEAISYGIPCVVTVGTNLADKVKEYDAGWIAENNSESLSSALLQMATERELFESKGERAFRLSKEYSWQVIAENTHKWLTTLVKSNSEC